MSATQKPRTWPLWVFSCGVPCSYLVYALVTTDAPRWVDSVTWLLLVGCVVSTGWQVRRIRRRATVERVEESPVGR